MMSSILSFFQSHRYSFAKFTCVAAALFTLSACDLVDNTLHYDREGELTKQDYRDGLAARPLPQKEEEEIVQGFEDGIPDLQSYIAGPSDDLQGMPLVSVSVNHTIPLRDVFFELAAETGLDLELDPAISGAIIFSAKDRPLDVVLDRIAAVSGLRYSIKNGVLRVEEDGPYVEIYKIDYVNVTRGASSSIDNSSSVVSGEASAGSSFSVSTSGDADFWGELDTGLSQVIGIADNTRGLRTDATPSITVAAQNTGAPVDAVTANDDGTVNVQPPNATLNVSSLPAASASGTGGGSGASEDASYTINRNAGLITVHATQAKHKEVKKFLDEVRRHATAQVLIEAKILEVQLTDELSQGINWNRFFSGGNGALTGGGRGPFNLDVSLPTAPPNLVSGLAAANTGGLTLNILDDDLFGIDAAVSLISQFATVRALSSPRLTVLNNNAAVLNVGTNDVFFEIEFEIEDGEDGAPAEVVPSSSPQTVSIGTLFNIIPSINLDERTVTMTLRPTITSSAVGAEDPAVSLFYALNAADFAAAGIQIDELPSSFVPIVDVQEFDSIVEVKSGELIVMGGLMTERNVVTEDGVPVLSDIPIVRNFASNKAEQLEKFELVLILQATIIDDRSETIHTTDRELYRMFASDRRPWDL